MVAPGAEQVAAVAAWLAEAGVRRSDLELSRSGDFLSVRGVPVGLASDLLQCPFEHFRSGITGQVVAACLAPYSVPSHIAPLLDFVGGVAALPSQSFPFSLHVASLCLLSPSLFFCLLYPWDSLCRSRARSVSLSSLLLSPRLLLLLY